MPEESTSSSDPAAGELHAARGAANSLAPRQVIRGESFTSPPKYTTGEFSTHTDWLSCTWEMADDSFLINEFRKFLSQALGKEFESLRDRHVGMNGFPRSFDIGNTSAKLAIGGKSGRAMLQFDGQACALLAKHQWGALCFLIGNMYGGRITRWDGAADDFEGVHSIEWAYEQYQAEKFSTGGNRPTALQHGDVIFRNGNGRTFEVGKRKNGKFLRIYEKGKQQGDPESEWVRWELQLGRRDRVIPWDVVINPAPYMASAYKCMDWISPVENKIKTEQRMRDANLKHRIKWCKRTYGALIQELTLEHSPEQIVSMLVKVPEIA